MRAARGTWRCGEPPGGIADVREQESRRAAADHLGALARVRSHGNDSQVRQRRTAGRPKLIRRVSRHRVTAVASARQGGPASLRNAS